MDCRSMYSERSKRCRFKPRYPALCSPHGQLIEEHENVVSLRDVFPHGSGFVLVFEYMLSDLTEVCSFLSGRAWHPMMLRC
jgi:hypothetical protein